ncbi:MAG: hypothetical protein KGS72_17225 [Cyanobacteria bacterium REEB67]|nr:hypothetical protein [Cyanobacteria bacterium REEB67]
MSDKVVAGAHFSASKENPNETWLVVGRLSNLGLEIFDVKKTGSHLLNNDLKTYKTLSALGIDCPFSWPEAFLNFLAVKKIKKNYSSWQEIVEELVFLPYDEFNALAKEYGKETKRVADTIPGTAACSPLKRANPANLHMTYHGMRTLATLDPARCYVVPFQDAIPFGCAVTETCPPDTLKYLGFKDLGYKAKDKTGEEAAEQVREKIVGDLIKLKERKALTYKDFPALVVQKPYMHHFLQSGQAIDALISCYTMGMMAAAPAHFADPFSADRMEVLLEGWIFRPQ